MDTNQLGVNPDSVQTKEQKSGFMRVLVDILETLVLAVVLFVGINMISARIRVDGASMEPTLQTGEYVIIGVHTSGVLDEMGRPYGCTRGTVLAPPGLMNGGVRITSEIAANVFDPRRLVGGLGQMQMLP